MVSVNYVHVVMMACAHKAFMMSLLATNVATESKSIKQSHDGANQGSAGHLTHKGPCKMVPVQEEIYRRWIALL